MYPSFGNVSLRPSWYVTSISARYTPAVSVSPDAHTNQTSPMTASCMSRPADYGWPVKRGHVEIHATTGQVYRRPTCIFEYRFYRVPSVPALNCYVIHQIQPPCAPLRASTRSKSKWWYKRQKGSLLCHWIQVLSQRYSNHHPLPPLQIPGRPGDARTTYPSRCHIQDALSNP